MKRKELLNIAFKTLLENTDAMVFVKDVNLVYVAASQPFAQMVGKPSAVDIVGHTDFEIFDDVELAKRYTEDDRKLLDTNKDLIDYIEPLTNLYGHPRYSNTSKYLLRDEADEVYGILGISRDVTVDYLAKQYYHQELQYLFELPENAYAALFLDIDDWRIIRHRSQAVAGQTVTIRSDMEAFRKNALNRLAENTTDAVREFFSTLSQETMQEMYQSGQRSYKLEYPRRMSNGDVHWVHVSIHFLIDPKTGHRCAVWILQNINRAKQEMIDLRYTAEHDALTGLLNRASTDRYINQILCDEEADSHALFILDVDNFKQLNDTYGHQTGDEFLVALAKVLKDSFRDYDVVGRIGGDEFFILMKNIPNDVAVTQKANMLLSNCKKVCDLYPDIPLSVSVGIGLYPLHGETLEVLYGKADEALYEAKKVKNRFVYAEK